MGFLKNIGKTVSNVVKNPVKAITQGDFLTYAGGSIGGIPGALIGNKIQKAYQKPLPEQAYFAEPRAIQDNLIKGQMSAADQYSNSLADNVNAEVSQTRAALEPQVAEAQRGARGDANARGMLFSGNRMKAESDIANEASSQLATARSNAIQKAIGQEQAMYAQPLQSRANVAETAMNQKGLLDGYKQQTEAQKTAQVSAGLGSVGAGLGKGLGNMSSGYRFGYNG